MAEPPDWMKAMDIRILELLAETKRVKIAGLWVKPVGVAYNLPADRSYVTKRLKKLAEEGYVDEEDGFYRINNRGYEYVQSGRP